MVNYGKTQREPSGIEPEKEILFLMESVATHFLCWAEERLVQITATITTTNTVRMPTVTTVITSRLLFFWGVTLPCGGCICPMGGSGGKISIECSGLGRGPHHCSSGRKKDEEFLLLKPDKCGQEKLFKIVRNRKNKCKC